MKKVYISIGSFVATLLLIFSAVNLFSFGSEENDVMKGSQEPVVIEVDETTIENETTSTERVTTASKPSTTTTEAPTTTTTERITTTTQPPPPPPPAIEKAAGDFHTATALNIRSGPGTEHSVVGGLTPYTEVSINAKSDGWYRIETDKWVSASYLKEGPAPDLPPPPPATPAPSPTSGSGMLWNDNIAGTFTNHNSIPCGGLWRYPELPNLLAREIMCDGSSRYLNLNVGDTIGIEGKSCTMVGSQNLNYNVHGTQHINWMGNTIVQTCYHHGGGDVKMINFNCN